MQVRFKRDFFSREGVFYAAGVQEYLGDPALLPSTAKRLDEVKKEPAPEPPPPPEPAPPPPPAPDPFAPPAQPAPAEKPKK